MALALRLLATLILAAIGWVLLGYAAIFLLGVVYGWSGHPAMPQAPWALYVALYGVALPVVCLVLAWKLTRGIQTHLQQGR